MEKQTFTNDNDGELILTEGGSIWCDNSAFSSSPDTLIQSDDSDTPNRVKMYKRGSYIGSIYLSDSATASELIEAFQA